MNAYSKASAYNFAYLDEQTKRMIRRAILKAVAIPGYQVPFASREMPMPYGWGTGGVQVTAAIVGPDDVLKVIDQGGESFVYLATPAPKKSSAAYERMERHLRHGEPVALVKAMRFASETLQNQRMRLREVAILVQCQHDSIIGVGQTRFRADGTLWVEL